MRNWYWKPMLGAGLLLTGLYALNPLNTATLDPRARLLGLTTYSIPSRSMAPTLDAGDYIAVSTAAYGFSEPQRGDVVGIDKSCLIPYLMGWLHSNFPARSAEI